MLLGFKTQLKITSPQTREILAQLILELGGVPRYAYNWGLWQFSVFSDGALR